VLFAARGVRLTCLEPDPAMAEVARRNLAPYDADVVGTSFEEWQPTERQPLLYAAQAWHWVSPAARCTKAHDLLRPGATLALFWNVGAYSDVDLREAMDETYRQLAPDTPDTWRPRHAQDPLTSNDWAATEIAASALFGPVTISRHRWQTAYSSEAWIELSSTQSNHRMLDDATRDALFDRVREVVAAHGGIVDVEYTATAYLAKALD